MRLLFILLFSTSLFALISIVPVEVGEKPGFSGKVGASLSTKRGNSDTDSYKAALRLTYDNNVSYVAWSELSGEYGEANNVKNVQKIYLHFRYIHNLQDKFNVIETFAQSQEDEFKLIDKRRLIGGGYRKRFFKNLIPLKFYIGVGGMYEYISYTSSTDPTENNVRANIYAAFTYPYEKRFDFSITSYYQPRIDCFSDFVTANKLELKIYIFDKMYLNFKISYDYDARPAIGVKKEDFSQDTAFVYEF
jgi:putative salt-induced outer membrane protein YdiY